MNDTERSQWIDNDEGLYNWWKASKLPKSRFINLNRLLLTKFIEDRLNHPNAAHSLVLVSFPEHKIEPWPLPADWKA